ncbi:hypothetical protein [Clostridium tagluense]|uniref:Uncharacterized protein n=1 Tax=Clostridium tagluense TaxID=360422 RepID=A0A401UU24_9CLOT|nr:hypothetical protein [Clostridium tagluense]GCD13006.1 hypothetical protein Ctaglu_46290 [Clostridium tagluense]
MIIFSNSSLWYFIYFNFNVDKLSILVFTSLNLTGNIIILILTILKIEKIKNWREVIINSTLYRYKHVKGEVEQIFKEGFGGIFYPIPKYAKYGQINNMNFSMKWMKLSRDLYKESEPDEIEMMINNEFTSNPLLRMHYVTLYWEERRGSIFRQGYLAVGYLLSEKGRYILYDTGNPIDSYILMALGTFLIWTSIFGYFTFLLKPRKFRKLKMFFIIVITLYNILNILIYFDIYRTVLPFDIFIFTYFYLSYRYTRGKVKKNYHYKYFNTLYI